MSNGTETINEILKKHFNNFRLSVGLPPEDMTEKAKEHFAEAMEEYAQIRLRKFCDHLGLYEGYEEIRFDFMLADFLSNKKPKVK